MDWKNLFGQTKSLLNMDGKLKSKSSRTWIGPGSTRNINGFNIPGIFYIGNHDSIPCVIDPNFSLENKSPFPEDTGYHPSYDSIGPRHRFHYLKWHSEGRKSNKVPLGYAFLHFYSLERRLLVGNPGDQEKQLLIQELERMTALFSDQRSFIKYSNALTEELEYRNVINNQIIEIHPKRINGMSPGLKLSISKKIDQSVGLSFKQALTGFMALPTDIFSTFYIRPSIKEDEIYTLLEEASSDYHEAFKNKAVLSGEGVSKLTQYFYKNAMWGLKLPEILHENNLPDPEKANWSDMANFLESALNKIRRKKLIVRSMISNTPDKTKELIRAEILIPKIAPPKIVNAKLTLWLDHVCESKFTTETKLLVTKVLGEVAVNKPNITKVSNILYSAGYGMEPDPLWSYILGPKENSFVFKLHMKETKNTVQDPNYILMLLCWSIMNERMDSISVLNTVFRPNLDILSRIHLCKQWWGNNIGGRIKSLTKLVVSSNHSQRASELVTQCMKLSGWNVDDLERMDTVWKYLGLGSAWSHIHSEMRTNQDPVLVKSGNGSTDWRIPKPDKVVSKNLIQLDEVRLEKIIQETKESTLILSEVWNEEFEDEIIKEKVSKYPGLPSKYGDLLDIVKDKSNIDIVEFQILCKKYNLTTDGVLEEINEWAFENIGDNILEESGDIITYVFK